jgi:hypothetical protein
VTRLGTRLGARPGTSPRGSGSSGCYCSGLGLQSRLGSTIGGRGWRLSLWNQRGEVDTSASQLRVRANVGNPSFLHHDDAVTVGQILQLMRDE